MAVETLPLFESADLRICPELGEVRNDRGESVRLGPVNMKVLALLVARDGAVVSRAELLDTVWRNQLVGDDTLTRSISDIRAELRRLTGRDGQIETLPKRGYRWLGAGRAPEPAAAPDDPPRAAPEAWSPPASEPLEAIPPPGAPTPDAPARPATDRWLAWARRGVVYAAALVALATAAVWLLDRLTPPAPVVVAILPSAPASSLETDLAAAIDTLLGERLMALDRVDVLSRSAVESRPGNPFPYFHYEFDARWLIESELRRAGGETLLAVGVVDARTGIVLFQSAQPVPSDGETAPLPVERALQPVLDFIRAELAP